MSEGGKPKRRRHPALDVRHPALRPLWRRAAVMAVLAGWVVMELAAGNPYWAMLAGGIGAYAFYEFFIVFDPKNYTRNDDEAV